MENCHGGKAHLMTRRAVLEGLVLAEGGMAATACRPAMTDSVGGSARVLVASEMSGH